MDNIARDGCIMQVFLEQIVKVSPRLPICINKTNNLQLQVENMNFRGVVCMAFFLSKFQSSKGQEDQSQ